MIQTISGLKPRPTTQNHPILPKNNTCLICTNTYSPKQAEHTHNKVQSKFPKTVDMNMRQLNTLSFSNCKPLAYQPVLLHMLIRTNIKIRLTANNYNYLSHNLFHLLNILIHTLKYITFIGCNRFHFASHLHVCLIYI